MNNNVSYDTKQIEKILNLINEIPFKGIDNAMKIAEIVNILNAPFVKIQQENLKNQNKENNK